MTESDLCRKLRKWVRQYDRLSQELALMGGTFPFQVKKPTCTMVLRFSSYDYDSYSTFDVFMESLKNKLSEFCKANGLELSVFFMAE